MSDMEYEQDRLRRMDARAGWLASELAALSMRQRVMMADDLDAELAMVAMVMVTKDSCG